MIVELFFNVKAMFEGGSWVEGVGWVVLEGGIWALVSPPASGSDSRRQPSSPYYTALSYSTLYQAQGPWFPPETFETMIQNDIL